MSKINSLGNDINTRAKLNNLRCRTRLVASGGNEKIFMKAQVNELGDVRTVSTFCSQRPRRQKPARPAIRGKRLIRQKKKRDSTWMVDTKKKNKRNEFLVFPTTNLKIRQNTANAPISDSFPSSALSAFQARTDR